MSTLEVLRANLLSPMVLAFVLGIVAQRLRSDLRFPEPIYDGLTIYLLLALGLKGGAELSHAPLAQIAPPLVAAALLGAGIPLWSYVILRKLGRLGIPDAAAIAAHYGSVSAVTFMASLSFLDRTGQRYEGFLPALLAVLEVPAIVVALLVARLALHQGGSWGELIRELLTGRSVVLLGGGLVIGWLSGKEGFAQVAPFFADAFKGLLTLFLLEMGMTTARRFRDLRSVGWFLLAFGIVMPVLHGALGVTLGRLSQLSLGGSLVLGVLAASASYIAAPAAVRLALPQASPSLYLTASLAITFPFNLVVGIPLYYWMARLVHGG